MVSLNFFRTIRTIDSGSCTECDRSDSPIVGLWAEVEDHVECDDSDAPYTLCPYCLVQGEGCFNSMRPVEVLKQFEEVTGWNIREEYLQIGTRSPLGYFFHVYYLQTGFKTTGRALHPQTGQPVVKLSLEPQLTGVSEIFDEDGVGLGAASEYDALARQILVQN